MATLGNTTKPATSQEWFGLNSTNHIAMALTLPAGGPWRIYRLGQWVAGQGETSRVRLCLWSAGGGLARQSDQFTAASMAFALGNTQKYEMDIDDYEVAGGTTVIVGFWRHPSDNTQHGMTGSGSHYHKLSTATSPQSLAGFSTHGGQVGAYLYYESANQAPNAPTNLSPTGNAVVSSGTSPTLSGTRSDPDGGDTLSAYQIVIRNDADSATVYDSGKINVGGAPTTFSRQVSLPASHTFYRWRARTWDAAGLVGPYSSLQRFKANSVPSAGAAPTVSSVATLTPTFGGVFTDPGDTLAAIRIQVEQPTSTSKWSSSDIAKSGASGASWSQAYGGSALSYGVAARVRAQVKDSHGSYSAWSAWKSWTPTQPQGPDSCSPAGTNPRLASLTPTLTVGHSANFRNEQIQVRTLPDGGGVLLWDKAKEGSDYGNTMSVGRTYAGTALSYGGTYYWRALVELSTGVDTEWSDWMPFRINATPNAPSGMSPSGGVVTSELQPTLIAIFNDPDTDQGDFADEVDVEVRDNSDDSLDWSQTDATPSDPDRHVVQVGTTLEYEKTYKWRARFKDEMGREGPYSSYQLFKVSEPPEATLVAPSDEAVVEESTPTLEWSFASPGGKAQFSYRVFVYDLGPTTDPFEEEEKVQVYDSGERIGADETHDVPFGVLVNDRDYQWTVVVKDTDGLSYTLE